MENLEVYCEPLNDQMDLFLGNAKKDRVFYLLANEKNYVIISDDIYPDSFNVGDVLNLNDRYNQSFVKNFNNMEITEVITKEDVLLNNCNICNFDGLFTLV